MDPSWPPSPPPRYNEAPRLRTSAWMLVAGAGLGAVLVLAGIGIAALVFDDGDDASAPAATTPVTATSPAPEGEGSSLPTPQPGVLTAILLFDAQATPAQMERIEEAWRDNPLLDGVFFATGEEVAAVAGVGGDSLGAFGAEEDESEIRTFVCRFADDPAVSLVGLYPTPC